MAKEVIVTDSDGNERQMFLQEQGSVVSKVSPYENSSWKTEENVFNSSIRDIDEDTMDCDNSDDSSCDDFDYGEFEGNTSNSSDDWVSNSGGADVPDYIVPESAYFDEEGNYAGGTYADQSDD